MDSFVSETLELECAVNTLGFATAMTKGISMLPFIVTGRDKVIIEKCEKRLQKFDIGVFKRRDGQFLMHRVKNVHENSYDFLGDNNLKRERNISDSLVIGIVKGYYKKDKFIDCSSKLYKIKTRIYCFPPIRIVGALTIRLLLKLRAVLKKVFKKK